MLQQTKQAIWHFVKLGVVGTIVGIPVGLWAMKQWPGRDEGWKTALLLTGVGALTHLGMTKLGERTLPGVEPEISGYTSGGSIWGAPHRGARGYMPAPAPGVDVYYRGVKNGRRVAQAGRNPTAL